jgi:hypothetical protein
MIYFLALIPATGLAVAGYFVLFLAHRSEGAFRAFGKYLGFWAFTLAGLVLLGAIFAAAHHGGRWGMMHERMGVSMMGGPVPGGPRWAGPCPREPGRDQSGEAPTAPAHPAPPNP